MRAVPFLVALLLAACFQHQLEVTPLKTDPTKPIVVHSPVKAHLKDGSTIVYPEGVAVEGGELIGDGQKYDLNLASSERVTRQALDAVAAMESYQTPVNQTKTVAVTSVGVVGGIVMGAALFKALFGSCPTIYTFDGDKAILEAESFSYSIAPGLEANDVDRLGVVDPGDKIRLELRNEALETHYINSLELLRVEHPKGTAVYPDDKGRPVVLSRLHGPVSARDRDGHSLDELVGTADGNAWRTADMRLAAASASDLDDFVEAEFDLPPGTREAGLVLRLRNSLLNTTLLYQVMLGHHGWRALDWMGDKSDPMMDIEKLRIAQWYTERLGMRVEVWDGAKYREVARLRDQGPIAWKDLAILIPVMTEGNLKVRLVSVVDNWRIDRIAASEDAHYASDDAIAVVRPTRSGPDDARETLDSLAGVDDRYLVTYPGERREFDFELGAVPEDRQRTLLVSASGYYVEWIRREWLQEADAGPFRPSDEMLLEAISFWQARRDDYRDRFEAMRVETR